jgi:hypothetical protein
MADDKADSRGCQDRITMPEPRSPIEADMSPSRPI